MNDEVWSEFAQACEADGIACDAALASPVGRLLALLERFAARTNLVGDAHPVAVLTEHVRETLALATLVERVAAPPKSVIDVGAGAGLEALVLALVWPECHVLALEPRRRRADFIEVAADAIGVGYRLNVAREPLERRPREARFALCTSRATFQPSEWLRRACLVVQAEGLVAVHGRGAGPREQPDVMWSAEGAIAVSPPGREVRVYRRRG